MVIMFSKFASKVIPDIIHFTGPPTDGGGQGQEATLLVL